MRGLILIPIFILISICVFAQSDRTINTHTAKATFIGLSYSYEQAIAQKSTVNFEMMLAGGFGSDFMNGTYWLIVPVMRVEPRYYYNFTKRFEKGKKTINNSANYLSISSDYQFETGIGSKAHSIGTFNIIPKWGMKRTIGNHFIFEFAAGIGAQKSENNNWKAAPGLDLKLGYSF